MTSSDGARFARVVLGAFDAMVAQVRAELEASGHPGLTVPNELAMQAIGEGADNAAALARAVGVTRQAAAKTIASLESLGYVERRCDTADGRRKQLAVTERGFNAITVGAAAFDAVYRRWRTQIGSADAALVERSLHRLASRT